MAPAFLQASLPVTGSHLNFSATWRGAELSRERQAVLTRAYNPEKAAPSRSLSVLVHGLCDEHGGPLREHALYHVGIDQPVDHLMAHRTAQI